MFRQSLPDPAIFVLVCADKQYKIVPCRVIGVEKVGQESKEAEAARENNQLILLSKLLEELLLVFLGQLAEVDASGMEVIYQWERQLHRLPVIVRQRHLGVSC
jgi:hypothetical protein